MARRSAGRAPEASLRVVVRGASSALGEADVVIASRDEVEQLADRLAREAAAEEQQANRLAREVRRARGQRR